MNTHSKIAIAGSTGRVGSHLVDVLEDAGHEVVAISRDSGVDVVTGEGLREALEGVSTLVDVTSNGSREKNAATEFFLTGARNVQDAGQQGNLSKIVLISIIGCDRFSGTGAYGGHYAAKAAQERAYREGPIPTKILRAAQFHEFVGQLLEWSTQDDIANIPDMRTQLVAARTVAEALAELAAAPTDDIGSDIAEVAGPRAEKLVDVARQLAERRGSPAQVREATDSDDPDGDLLAGDALLPGPSAQLAGPTFEHWLNTEVAALGSQAR